MAAIQQISETMNARGLFHSSIHVNDVSKACAAELRNVAGLIWESVKRAHESCRLATPERFLPLYLDLLRVEVTKMSAVLDNAVGRIAAQLQSKSMAAMREIPDEHDALVEKYKVEIDMYISNLRQGAGATHPERIRQGFLNRPPVAVGIIVAIVIVGLAGFTEAIEKLIKVANVMFGDR